MERKSTKEVFNKLNENGTGVSWNDKTLKESIDEIIDLIETRALTVEELGRLWLLCYTEQETAWMEDRRPAYDEKSFSQLMALDMHRLDAMDILKKQADLTSFSLLVDNIKKAVATADSYAHTAQSAYYAYMYEITQELQHQTAVTLALATPIILEQDEYKALEEQAGSSNRADIAKVYAATYNKLEDMDRREFIKTRGTFSGFAVMQDKRTSPEYKRSGELLKGISEQLEDPTPRINRKNVRVYFENYYYALGYIYHLYRVLQLFSRSYKVPHMEKLIDMHRINSFFGSNPLLGEQIKTLETIMQCNGFTTETAVFPRFNRELPRTDKKSLQETRERFRDHDPAKDKDFNDYLLEIAKKRKYEGIEELQKIGY